MTDGRNETRERERERESVKAETPFLLASFHLLPGSTNVTREEVMSRLRYLTPRKSFHAHARNKFEGARLIREWQLLVLPHRRPFFITSKSFAVFTSRFAKQIRSTLINSREIIPRFSINSLIFPSSMIIFEEKLFFQTRLFNSSLNVVLFRCFFCFDGERRGKEEGIFI